MFRFFPCSRIGWDPSYPFFAVLVKIFLEKKSLIATITFSSLLTFI